MRIQSLLSIQRTRCCVEASSKRRALEILAQTIAQDVEGVNADDLLRNFLARERLGSTGIGHGIAIPHCRINQKYGEDGAIAALITLTHPVEFDAIDAEPVDILFAMLVPEESHDLHLKNLAALANALTSTKFRHELRAATDDQTLFNAAIANAQLNSEGTK